MATIDKTENIWLSRLLSFLITVGLSVSGYFLNQTMQNFKEIEKRVAILEINSATTNANKFTSQDWLREKSLIDAQGIQTEKRIIRLEETIVTIKDSLIEIKKDLSELKNK